ncbi:MAG: VOC family protein [Phycisphaerales bacterium]|nr:VOC family protein [Phycisphaerales bacterium]
MPNPLCHFEFMTGDVQKCREFYGKVFDWTFDDQAMPGYTLIHTGADPGGGLMSRPAVAPMACLTVYFSVADMEQTIRKVKEGGGRILVEPTDIPHVGTYAIIADPEQVVVGLLKPAG